MVSSPTARAALSRFDEACANVTSGSVSAESGLSDATRLQFTAPIQHGNSGGPLIGKDGRIVSWYPTNDWEPAEVFSAMKSAAAA